MIDTFDPYQQWLEIPPEDQPPDHYRLLGVPRFTEDAAVIARAADERMAAVQRFQAGPRGEYVPLLVNELMGARLCLTNPSTKAAYDSQLRRRLDTPRTVPLARLAVPLAQPSTAPVVAPPTVSLPPAPPTAFAAPRPMVGVDYDAKVDADDEPPPANLGWRLAFVTLVLLVGLAVGWAIVRGPFRPPRSASPPAEEGSLADGGDPPATIEDSPAPPKVANEDGAVVLMQESDGAVNFLPETATVHGENARLELRRAEGVIANWLSPDDWLSWEFRVLKPGFFEVEIVYGASDAMEGGRYTVVVEGQEQTRTVNATGGEDSFGRDTFYLALTRNGRQTLALRPERVSDAGLMVFKSLRLAPTAKRESE